MERISKKPTPDCPLCGWSRKDHPMATHEWATKTGECAGEDREPCLLRQLAAANEKLADSARLATESAQLADGMANDLAAANEKIAGWEKAAESWFASPEAAQRLEGYRELALKVNAAELALAAANERAGRLEEAVRWALGGPGSDFRGRNEGEGQFYWRSELMKRAGFGWDTEAGDFCFLEVPDAL